MLETGLLSMRKEHSACPHAELEIVSTRSVWIVSLKKTENSTIGVISLWFLSKGNGKAELCSHALHLFKLLSSPTNEKLQGCLVSNWRPFLFWVYDTTHSENKPTTLIHRHMMKTIIFHQAQTIHSLIGSERLPVHLLHFRRLVSASLKKTADYWKIGPSFGIRTNAVYSFSRGGWRRKQLSRWRLPRGSLIFARRRCLCWIRSRGCLEMCFRRTTAKSWPLRNRSSNCF